MIVSAPPTVCPVCKLHVNEQHMRFDVSSNRDICCGCHSYVKSCAEASGHSHRLIIKTLRRQRRFYEEHYRCF